MAITFGSNIGSKSLGSFAILPAQVEAGDTVTLLAVGAAGAVEYGDVLPDTFTITEQQAIGIQDLLVTLIDNSGGDYAGNELAYLRKLVGAVSLTDGQTLTLSIDTATVGPTTYTLLNATCTIAGTVLMYIPNSVAAGLYTGVGAEKGGGTPPVVPTTFRYDYIANVPGLYLPGVACLVGPNTGAGPVTLDAATARGFAQTAGVTASRSFLVEKFDVSAPVAPGLGTKLYDVTFLSGNQLAIIENVTPTPADLVIGNFEAVRVVNPLAGDADLADVAITVGGVANLNS